MPGKATGTAQPGGNCCCLRKAVPTGKRHRRRHPKVTLVVLFFLYKKSRFGCCWCGHARPAPTSMQCARFFLIQGNWLVDAGLLICATRGHVLRGDCNR